MTRNCFDEIWRCLHLADNTNLPRTDKFAKVRLLLDTINNNASKPSRHNKISNLSIDKSLVPYFGRHNVKQYIRGKSVIFGYKMWCLGTPAGQLVQMQPYQGKGPGGATIAGLGLVGSVLELLAALSGLGTFHYQIYMDSFLTSAALADHLTQIQVGVTGTVRACMPTGALRRRPTRCQSKRERGDVTPIRPGQWSCGDEVARQQRRNHHVQLLCKM